MTIWLTAMALGWNWRQIIFGLGIFLITFAGSLALVSFLVVKIPADYFHPRHKRVFLPDSSPAIRLGAMILKNVAGLLLMLLGIVMSVPGIPGQGLLTILLGLALMDFPGKEKLEQKIVRRPWVLNALNGIRAKFSRPPLILD